MTATTRWHDPVVAEIHATRERLAEQYQNDLLAYSEAAEAHCRALGLNMAEDQRRMGRIGTSRLIGVNWGQTPINLKEKIGV